MSIRQGYQIAAVPEPLPHLEVVHALAGAEVASGIAGDPAAVAMLLAERDAFVVVEAGPTVTVRTLLDDGRLVETLAGAEARTFARAPRRSVRTAPLDDVLARHRAHLENTTMSSAAKPVAHESVSLLMDLWNWAAEHEDRVLDHIDDVLDRTPRHLRLAGLATAVVLGLVFAIADRATLAAVGVLLGGVVALLAGPVASVLVALPSRRPAFQAGTPSVR